MWWSFVLLICLTSVEADVNMKAYDQSGNEISCMKKFASAKITCTVTSLRSSVIWQISNGPVRVRCSNMHDLCVPSNVGQYTFTTNLELSEFYLDIYNYSTPDGAIFTCIHANEAGRFTALQCVPIVSVILKHDDQLVNAAELDIVAGTPTDLTCATSPNPSVPEPTIGWYVGTLLVQSSTSKIFILTATDEDHGRQIYCKAYNTQPADALESHKPRLYIKVKVPYVILTQENETLTDGKTLNTKAGTPVDLTCIPGNSRPAATTDWFINEMPVLQSASTYTLNATDDDHDCIIYCKAYNIPGEGFVVSGRPTLYVFVTVSSVTLKQGTRELITDETLTVTQGESIALECIPGPSRPPPKINWFIGGQPQSNTGRTVVFDFNNTHHDKTIYCTAFNSQIATEEVKSQVPNLYVRVKARSPELHAETTDLLEGDMYNLQCHSTATRPTSVVIFQIENTILTVSNITETRNSVGLISVIATVSYKASKNHHKLWLACISKIANQSDYPKTEKLMTILWPPATPVVIPTSKPFPWLEGQTGVLKCISSDPGNPLSSVTWLYNFGKETSEQELVIGPLTYEQDQQIVKCHLQNSFTSLKGRLITSYERRLYVEYSPKVTMQVDNAEVYSVRVVEGKNLTANCTAVGNPQPETSWPAATYQSSGGVLTFIDISRSQADNYTCRAAAVSQHYPVHDFVTEAVLSVSVVFPPDVTIEVSGQFIENGSVKIRCLPDGLPRIYRFGRWKQVWRETEITSNKLLSTDNAITISSLQLQDSGNYTCSADNSIPDKQNKFVQTATTEIRVKGSPKIFMMESVFAAGIQEENVTVSFPFYTYPKYMNFTFKKNDTKLHNSSKYRMFIDEAKVRTAFYGINVQLEGYILKFTIVSLEENDFTNYNLQVVNDMGQKNVSFSVVSRSMNAGAHSASSLDVGAKVGAAIAALLIAVVTTVAVVFLLRTYKRVQVNKNAQKRDTVMSLTKRNEYVNASFSTDDTECKAGSERTGENMRSAASEYDVLDSETTNKHIYTSLEVEATTKPSRGEMAKQRMNVNTRMMRPKDVIDKASEENLEQKVAEPEAVYSNLMIRNV